MIQRYIDQKGLRDCVHLVGFMQHSDLKALYLGATNAVYCSTSVSETFGQNIIEAGICRLPIFTNKNIETDNMFLHAENAYVFHSVETCVAQLQDVMHLSGTERAHLAQLSMQNCRSYDMDTSINTYFHQQ